MNPAACSRNYGQFWTISVSHGCVVTTIIIEQTCLKIWNPKPVHRDQSLKTLVKSLCSCIFCICHLCCNSIYLPLIQRVTILLHTFSLSQRLKPTPVEEPKCSRLLFWPNFLRHIYIVVAAITVVRPFHIRQSKAFTSPYKIKTAICVYNSSIKFCLLTP